MSCEAYDAWKTCYAALYVILPVRTAPCFVVQSVFSVSLQECWQKKKQKQKGKNQLVIKLSLVKRHVVKNECRLMSVSHDNLSEREHPEVRTTLRLLLEVAHHQGPKQRELKKLCVGIKCVCSSTAMNVCTWGNGATWKWIILSYVIALKWRISLLFAPKFVDYQHCRSYARESAWEFVKFLALHDMWDISPC